MFIRVRILHRTVLYLYPSPSRHVLQKNHDQLTTFAFVPHPPLCSALYTLIYSMHISCLGCFFLPPARRPRSVTVTRASRRVSHRIASRIDSSRPVSERTSSPRPHHSSSTRNPRRTASYLFVLSTSERSNRTSHHPPCSVAQRPPPLSRFSISILDYRPQVPPPPPLRTPHSAFVTPSFPLSRSPLLSSPSSIRSP